MKHILGHCREEFTDRTTATYFFNARGDDLEKTSLGMLRSLLYQLLSQDPWLYDRFIPLFRKHQDKYESWEWREAELKDFLLSEIGKCRGEPLLLIDALDECHEPDRINVLEFLESLSIRAAHSRAALNICLSSRHYPNVSMSKFIELDIDRYQEHDEDIRRYIRDKLKIQTPDMEGSMLAKAAGIFMWAVLVTGMLNRAFESGQIETATEMLDNLPNDLEEVFQALLKDDNQNDPETILILQWVLFARRPLEPKELYYGMTAGTSRENTKARDRRGMTADDIRRRITSSSRGLVEIRQASNTVQFIHETVHDFLLRYQRLQRLSPALRSNPIGTSHDNLKDCCLSYLMTEGILIPKTASKAELHSSYPFLDYASNFILEHSEEAQARGIQQKDFVRFLQEDNGQLERLSQFHSIFAKQPADECTNGVTMLYICAFRGHKELVKVLLEIGGDVNAKGGLHGTILHAAIAKDNQDIARLLLNGNADINAQAGYYGTALQAASARGNGESVQMLLERGADIHVEGGHYGNSLRAALRGGHEKVVEMLLREDFDVNAQGGRYGNMLQEASEYGYEGIVKMLLENGANVMTQGGEFGTALQAASRRGTAKIVRMLLLAGADVNAQGGVYGNALQAASENGNVEVVGMLLNNGADINAQGGIYGNALQAAVENSNSHVVKLLLDSGIDVNAGGANRSPLQPALQNGDHEIAGMLLKKGATFNTDGARYEGWLRDAIARLEKEYRRGGTRPSHEAHITTKGTLYGNRLQTASVKGEKHAVRMLLEKGADVNARGGLYGTALQAASAKGWKNIVEILLAEGADIKAQGGVYGNALQAASKTGNQDIQKMLLTEWLKGTSWS